jgi:hypothetical protein
MVKNIIFNQKKLWVAFSTLLVTSFKAGKVGHIFFWNLRAEMVNFGKLNWHGSHAQKIQNNFFMLG